MENYFQILFIKDRNNYNSLKFLIKQKKMPIFRIQAGDNHLP